MLQSYENARVQIRWHSHVNMPGSNSQASKRDNVQKHK